MKYPKVYDISLNARIVLGFYVRGVRPLENFKDQNGGIDKDTKELIKEGYIKIENDCVVIIRKNPRSYKRDRQGKFIPFKNGSGFHYQ